MEKIKLCSMAIKLCPIAKDDCIEDDCMWYDSSLEKCAVSIIADELINLRQIKENENSNEED